MRKHLHWLPFASQVAAWWLLAVAYGLTGWTIEAYVHDGATLGLVSVITACGAFMFGAWKAID